MSNIERVLEIAARFQVRVDFDRRGRPKDVFPWSFEAVDGFMCIGPSVVYGACPVDDEEAPSGTVPAWAKLLHEIGHAHCRTEDEDIVSGWTQCVAATYLESADLTVMQLYDEDAGVEPAVARAAAVLAGVVSENYEPL